MLSKQFSLACEDAWVDKERLKSLNLTPLEKALVNQNKIAYMVGKGNTLVPVIFPLDTLPALKILVDEEYRKIANVMPSNPYLFPSTRQSDFHLSGWHALDSICQGLPLEQRENICSTKNRHFISTIYSSMELPNHEKESFYNHMGHSAAMNQARYQCPPAIRELTKVGKTLFAIDQGNHLKHRAYNYCVNLFLIKLPERVKL